MPRPGSRGDAGWALRLVSVAVVAELVAAFAGVAALRLRDESASVPVRATTQAGTTASPSVRAVPPPSPPSTPPPRRATTPGAAPAAPARPAEQARERAVRALLASRAAAVTRHDRRAFLATVDPGDRGFAARQGRLFDALRGVPLSSWEYQLDAHAPQPPDAGEDRRRGRGWWAPGVTLRYRLAGFDRLPTLEAQHLTFVPRRGRWLLAADDDFARAGRRTTRALWDAGRVVALRGQRSLVLGHAGSPALLRAVATAVDAAVPRVTRVWGRGWDQKVVVLVPRTQAELGRLLGSQAGLANVAAVATAELDERNGYQPVGNRVLVNPVSLRRLTALGQQVVLTHEVTHVATRAATGPVMPSWLAEGFADHVAFAGVQLPLAVTAPDLRAAVRAGHVPARLPLDTDFDPRGKGLTTAYEQAWLAVTLLAERYGDSRLLAFYRAVGRARGSTPAAGRAATAAALRGTYGLTEQAFVSAWVADLRRRLG